MGQRAAHAGEEKRSGKLGLGLGKEREGERARGGKRSWATVAHAGEGEGKEPERERELGCWALFPLLFQTQSIHTNPFEFNQI
jgi:hypothetical protein